MLVRGCRLRRRTHQPPVTLMPAITTPRLMATRTGRPTNHRQLLMLADPAMGGANRAATTKRASPMLRLAGRHVASEPEQTTYPPSAAAAMPAMKRVTMPLWWAKDSTWWLPQDVSAQLDALITDICVGSSDQFGNLVLALAAEGASALRTTAA